MSLLSRLGLCLVVAVSSARGAVLALDAARLEGDGWEAGPLHLALEVEGPLPALELKVARFRLEPAALEGRDLRLACPRLELDETGDVRCPDARLTLAMPPWKSVQGRLRGAKTGEGLTLSLSPLSLDGGRIEGTLSVSGAQSRADLRFRGLDLAVPGRRWFVEWQPRGRLGGRFAGALETDGRWRVHGRWTLAEAAFSDVDGLRVGEGLSAVLTLEGRGRDGSAAGSVELTLSDGQLYLDPFYLAFERPLRVAVRGRVAPGELRLSHFEAAMDGVFHAAGRLRWHGGRLHGLRLRAALDDLEQAYPSLLQPVLIGTALDDLEVEGRASGTLVWGADGPEALGLMLDGVTVADRGGRFRLAGVDADLNWAREDAPRDSTLAWREAGLYRIGLGGTRLQLQAAGDRVTVAPFSLDLLDGRLEITGLMLTGFLSGALEAVAGARLKGVKLEALSRALSWPPLQGEVNAVLPRLHYHEGRLSLEGDLVVELFGGKVVVEGLEIQDPLGPAPVLETRLRLENLDLAQLSATFSFGRIEGSLEGRVRNLRLVGWELAAFDAELRSPSDDPRPHRISQRAIDDLTELGNGVASGLSGTFLGVFKTFAYDRLALRVRLEGDTAHLDGAPRTGGGYYIVKGALLPRVDVIGRNHRVAWKELLSRLRNIRVQKAVVE